MKKIAFFILCLAPAGALAAPTQYTVVKGDHLWALAGRFYQNHFRWKVIYSANQDKIKDPNLIFPGQSFAIPDVPGPEIGELGARPVETGLAVKAPEPSPEPPAAAAPAPEPPAAVPAPVPEPAPAAAEDPARRDDVSSELPPQATGQYPSMTRLKAPAGWTADGRVVEFEGREVLAAQGDSVNGKLEDGVAAQVGQRFAVYRRDAPQEMEDDKKATYLQRVGWAKVTKALGGSEYTFLVLKSGDSLQVGDLLKREDR